MTTQGLGLPGLLHQILDYWSTSSRSKMAPVTGDDHPQGPGSWLSSEDLFYYFKIVDNYYYQQVDINKVRRVVFNITILTILTFG